MPHDITRELQRTLRLPVIVAPMFLISGPDLVIAAAKAGLIGAFPAPNARTINDLADWLDRISPQLASAGCAGRWAINLVAHPTYDRFEAEMDLVTEHRPRLVITALGSPKRALDRVHAYGGWVFADVISADHARKAADAGADGLVLVASGAGGHTGPYSAFAFVEEVRRFWDGPLVLGGALSSGRSIRAALTLGADLAYMGTRFIAARESLVSDDYRDMLVRARMGDIVTSKAITGVAGNWLRESVDRAALDPDALARQAKIDFSDIQGDTKAWKNIWGAGQGVSAVGSICTVAEIVEDLAAQYEATRAVEADLACWPAAVSTGV